MNAVHGIIFYVFPGIGQELIVDPPIIEVERCDFFEVDQFPWLYQRTSSV